MTSTLKLVLQDSVVGAVSASHLWDVRYVEIVACNLVWMQISEINDYRKLKFGAPPLENMKALQDTVVESCIRLSMKSDGQPLFWKIKENPTLCKSIDEALAAMHASMPGRVDMPTLLQKANEHLQSKAFIDALCDEMFRRDDMPLSVYSERHMRELFAGWRKNDFALPFFAHFIADIVYKSISKYVRESIYNDIRSPPKSTRSKS